MPAHPIITEDLTAAFFDPYALDGLRGSHVTVTGTGFVGTWLAEAVAHLNDEHSFGTSMTLISRSADRFAMAAPHLRSRPEFSFVQGDVRHSPNVPMATNYLVHTAATPDTRVHASRPVDTMTTIADGTLSVLNAVRNSSDLRLVLNLSSALAAGAQPLDLEELPDSASGAPEPGSASSAYAEAKRYAETLCAAVRSQDRLPIANVRPFAFLGPFQSLSTPWAANAFMAEALAGGPIRVLGTGRTVRSYLYGSNVAFWLLRMAVAAKPGDRLNLGSAEAVDLDTVARTISAACDPAPDIVLNFGGGSSAGRESRLVPSITGAQALGLTVTVPFAEAVRRTMAWNRAHIVKETAT